MTDELFKWLIVAPVFIVVWAFAITMIYFCYLMIKDMGELMKMKRPERDD